MIRLEVEPRSPGWFEVRAQSWTASIAAVLCARPNAELLRDCAAAKGITLDIAPLLAVGLDSFYENTLWKVWAEKTGRIPRFGGNAHTERGTENEERVIQVFEKDQSFLVEREVTVLSRHHPWLLASYDALAPASSDPSVKAPYGFPVEAKCPAFQSRKKLWDSRKAGKLAIMGLPYYWCQVQHQILTAESPYGWFVAAGVEVNPKTGLEEVVFPLCEKVPRDDAFLEAYLAAADFFFHEYLDTFTEPPKLASDVELLRQLEEKAAFDRAMASSDVQAAAVLYLEALLEEKKVVARRKELETKVLRAADGMRAVGTDVVKFADCLEVVYSRSKAVSWQNVAKELASIAKIDKPTVDSVIAKCEKERAESAKIKLAEAADEDF